MIYREFKKGKIKVSSLGFGAMRFPTIKNEGDIDVLKTEEMLKKFRNILESLRITHILEVHHKEYTYFGKKKLKRGGYVVDLYNLLT